MRSRPFVPSEPLNEGAELLRQLRLFLPKELRMVCFQRGIESCYPQTWLRRCASGQSEELTFGTALVKRRGCLFFAARFWYVLLEHWLL